MIKKILINVNDLEHIKLDLKASLKTLELLLNALEASSCDEYWDYIPDIEEPVKESIEKRNRLTICERKSR